MPGTVPSISHALSPLVITVSTRFFSTGETEELRAKVTQCDLESSSWNLILCSLFPEPAYLTTWSSKIQLRFSLVFTSTR